MGFSKLVDQLMDGWFPVNGVFVEGCAERDSDAHSELIYISPPSNLV